MDTATTLAAAAFLISLLVAVLGWTARALLSSKEKETERRLGESEKMNSELRGDLKTYAERLRVDELKTNDQGGEIKRLSDKDDVILEDLRELKRSMQHLATKSDVTEIYRRLDDIAGKPPKPRFTPGPIPRVDETSTPPPRDRDRNR